MKYQKMWLGVKIASLASLLVACNTLPSLMTRGPSPPVETSARINNVSAQSMETSEADGKRYALIIGNADYSGSNWPDLRNPIHDAEDMTTTLKRKSFNVITLTNAATRGQMKQALRKFGEQLKQRNAVGLFFYAGHGAQFDGKNYLIPTQANTSKRWELEDEALPVQYVLNTMSKAGNGMNIVILDACRSNKLPSATRGNDNGLAKIDSPPYGSIIVFPTEPDQVARDGYGRNGTFTEQLLAGIEKNGHMSILDMLVGVRNAVANATGNMQIPQNYDALTKQFCFSGCQELKTQQQQQEELQRLRQERARLEAEKRRIEREKAELEKTENDDEFGFSVSF